LSSKKPNGYFEQAKRAAMLDALEEAKLQEEKAATGLYSGGTAIGVEPHKGKVFSGKNVRFKFLGETLNYQGFDELLPTVPDVTLGPDGGMLSIKAPVPKNYSGSFTVRADPDMPPNKFRMEQEVEPSITREPEKDWWGKPEKIKKEVFDEQGAIDFITADLRNRLSQFIGHRQNSLTKAGVRQTIEQVLTAHNLPIEGVEVNFIDDSVQVKVGPDNGWKFSGEELLAEKHNKSPFLANGLGHSWVRGTEQDVLNAALSIPGVIRAQVSAVQPILGNVQIQAFVGASSFGTSIGDEIQQAVMYALPAGVTCTVEVKRN